MEARTIWNVENYIKEFGAVTRDFMSNMVIETRIYGGYFLKNALSEQVKCELWEELFLKSDSLNEVDCFAVSVNKKVGDKFIQLWFLKKELANAINGISNYRCLVNETLDGDDVVGRNKALWIWIQLLNIKRINDAL